MHLLVRRGSVAQQPEHDSVAPGAIAPSHLAQHALPLETDPLQGTLLGKVFRFGPRFQPMRRRVREQIVHKQALRRGPCATPTMLWHKSRPDLQAGTRRATAPYVFPRDNAGNPAARKLDGQGARFRPEKAILLPAPPPRTWVTETKPFERPESIWVCVQPVQEAKVRLGKRAEAEPRVAAHTAIMTASSRTTRISGTRAAGGKAIQRPAM